MSVELGLMVVRLVLVGTGAGRCLRQDGGQIAETTAAADATANRRRSGSVVCVSRSTALENYM